VERRVVWQKWYEVAENSLASVIGTDHDRDGIILYMSVHFQVIEHHREKIKYLL
jgi:hypothetical protein